MILMKDVGTKRRVEISLNCLSLFTPHYDFYDRHTAGCFIKKNKAVYILTRISIYTKINKVRIRYCSCYQQYR